MLLERKRARRFNEPMDFLARVIADLATLVTFQQRQPTVDKRNLRAEMNETTSRVPSSTRRDAGIGPLEDGDVTDV